MEGPTTLLSTSSHFPISSKDFIRQAYHSHHGVPSTSTRKRKPIVTYQSPGSGVVDIELLVRNTALEIETAAAAAARAVPTPAAAATTAMPAPGALAQLSASVYASTTIVEHVGADTTSMDVKTTAALRTRVAAVHRLLTMPRPPHPLYHPFSRPSSSKPAVKTSTTSSGSASQLVPPTDTGRRSSSRTRRPAPKMRDSEGVASASKVGSEKPSPAKRRRGGGGGRRKRGAAQLEVDGDAAYPSSKRARKPRERMDVDVESEAMPPPTTNGASPPSGYSTRAKRPRTTAHARAESSTSDGTGSATRTTPVNGHVEEFWVPIRST